MSWQPPPPSDPAGPSGATDGGGAPVGGYPPPQAHAGTAPPTSQGGYPPAHQQAATPASWHTAVAPAPPVADGLVTAIKVLIVLQLPVLFVLSGLRLRYASQLADGASFRQLESTELTLGLVVIAYLLFLAIPAAICWCLWQARTHRRLAWLRPQAGFRQSVGWGVWSWFVPIANLFVPFRAVADLWRNSAPPGATGPDPTPRAVGTWWVWMIGVPLAMFVSSFIIGFVLAAGGQPPSDAAIMRLDGIAGLIQNAALAVAAWFVVRLVADIHGRVKTLDADAER